METKTPMQNKTLWTLASLLVLQLVAAVLLTLQWQGQQENPRQGNLLALAFNQVDNLVVDEPNKPSLKLVKKEGQWQLPDYFNLPVQTGKLQGLFSQLEGLQRNWPVANTEATAKRFEVSDEKFQRRLQLKQGDKVLATLYLGTSPGYRKTHVRVNGENDVYALAINLYDLPTGQQDWVDNGLLQVNTDQLASIEGPDYTLAHDGDHWLLAGLGDQEETNHDAVQQLLNGLSTLNFQEALGTANQPAYGLEQPALTLKLQGRDKAQTYTFGKPQEGDYYVLKTSEQAPYFKVPATELEALINLKRAALAKHKPNQAEGTTAPSDSTG